MKKKILIAFGTRPEAVKFAPLIRALKSSKDTTCYVCSTGQHREMVAQVIRFFKIKVDTDLRLMKNNQSLEYVSEKLITKFGEIIRRINPDLVFVLGDTATAVMVALTSYYAETPVAHLEAGLRTGNKFHPFPEEGNRRLISHLADYHFTPTSIATNNLLQEGVRKKSIFQVGNIVVDAIRMTKSIVKDRYPVFDGIDFSKRIIFVTAHRRESLEKGLKEVFSALKTIIQKFQDVEIVYPVHLNPRVQKPAQKMLGAINRIHLIRPLTYEEMLWIMSRCYLILTDSGGIQEEAPSFKKPVLVLRYVTERPEGVRAGIAKIVGTNRRLILKTTSELLSSAKAYQSMVAKRNPYGDGYCTERIMEQLKKIFRSGGLKKDRLKFKK